MICCTACEGHFAWYQQNATESCGGCSQIVYAHCMVEAYGGQVRLCKKCILQTNHMYELTRAREFGRLQSNVTEGSQTITHRALQIGQVVGGSIGGLAAVGLNFGVGVSSGVCGSARALTTPLRHVLPQRVQGIEDSQLRDSVQKARGSGAGIFRE